MSPRTACLALTLSALAALPAPAVAADDTLLAAARAAQPALVATLREMVAIESGTMDAKGLALMADDVERRLKALGATVERRKTTAGNSDVLVARFSGSGKRRFMLIGHLDTVYWPGTITSQPIKQDGNRLYGPGIADDKAGVALILHAVELLHRSGWRDYAQLTLMFNGDEESGSPGSGEMIAALGAEHDTVLSFEPTAATTTPQGEGVLLNAAGTATATMQVKGRAAHAGAAPQLGRNALVELAHQVLQTQDVAKGVPGAQLNWTTFDTGKTRNQIPELATAGADVRLTRGDAADKLLDALRAKVAESKRVPDTEVSLKLDIGRPPFVGDARTTAIAKRAQAIYAELDGRKLALHPITGGGTDAGFAGRSGKAAVLESLGLPGAGYHARDEYIELDTIVPRLYLVSRLLMELGRE
ncbi:glutamate carboxypeptidase [Ideonella sp. A 288]|uniref:glutamate carboxypeptidase n=1 Tax=Ideonella sp. A 288 TaxID=1962181 RepID=UPI000B4A794A|nr:glutamate carboxypeptidase [Ideonella sp. A 288]